ncbi:MAG: response regulator transcription factor [Sulfurospirillum sp.]
MSDKKDILKSLTLLIAEDEDPLRESMTRIFKLFFGKVLSAKDGAEALKFFKHEKVHVVLLDYVMPLIDGHEVAKKIRESDKSIPILITSAYSDKEKLLNSVPLNLVCYIEKPILYDDLHPLLNAIVDRLYDNHTLITRLNDNCAYNTYNKTVIMPEGQEVRLTKHEAAFLELLLTRPNELFTKEVIEDKIYSENINENALRNMVFRLRKKLVPNLIVTLKDFGYLLKI